MNVISLYSRILSNHNEMAKNSLSNLHTPITESINFNGKLKDEDTNNDKVSFKDIIGNEIQKLNDKQVKADKLTEAFITGEVEDLHTVLIATEEARLSLELAVQVRNKLVEGFKEINNIQL